MFIDWTRRGTADFLGPTTDRGLKKDRLFRYETEKWVSTLHNRWQNILFHSALNLMDDWCGARHRHPQAK
jgi:hypothetical protein